MPKVNVYLPDELHERLKFYEIPLSQICQAAIKDEIDRRSVVVETVPSELDLARARVAELEEWKRMYETGTIGYVLNAAEKINEQNLRLKDTLTHIALEEGVDVDTLRAWALGVLKEVFPEDFDPNYKGPSDGS
jgi:hypothetical protein